VISGKFPRAEISFTTPVGAKLESKRAGRQEQQKVTAVGSVITGFENSL
jgi:hypothetical protein